MRKLLLRLVYRLCRALRPQRDVAQLTFLILQYRIPLGCCVHGTPIYAALKAANPDCKVIVATYGLGTEVLSHNPNIDHLIETGVPPESALGLLSFANALRKRLNTLGLRPTQILQDASNRRGTLALLALLLRCGPTAGFADLPELYDRHFEYDLTESLIANNLRLVAESTPHIEPAVYFTTVELNSAQTLLQRANPQAQPLTALIVKGSGAQPNSWHDDRFAEVIRYVESLGHRTIFLGTANEAHDIDRVRSVANSSGRSLAGLTNIPTLAALLCLCDYVISVDTGSMHVARSAGTPMIVLGPSWQPAMEWLPLNRPYITVLRGPDMAVTQIPSDYRLDEITTIAVVAAFARLTTLYPPSHTDREQRVGRLLTAS